KRESDEDAARAVGGAVAGRGRGGAVGRASAAGTEPDCGGEKGGRPAGGSVGSPHGCRTVRGGRAGGATNPRLPDRAAGNRPLGGDRCPPGRGALAAVDPGAREGPRGG